jgi:hypothetical protein
MKPGEIISIIGLALKIVEELIGKIDEVKDENKKSELQDALRAHDLERVRLLLFG